MSNGADQERLNRDSQLAFQHHHHHHNTLAPPHFINLLTFATRSAMHSNSMNISAIKQYSTNIVSIIIAIVSPVHHTYLYQRLTISCSHDLYQYEAHYRYDTRRRCQIRHLKTSRLALHYTPCISLFEYRGEISIDL